MELSKFAVPTVYVLIAFLAYSSQLLFLYLEPHPLTKDQLIRFNGLIVCLLICYTQSVLVDPGQIPKKDDATEKEIEKGDGKQQVQPSRKWCRKCNAAKPPRAHHCRECKRCIPKMDHHCPWTQNCVSHTTFPHFLRFLFYAVTSLLYLSSFLWTRCAFLFHNRDLPAYLGPTAFQLVHLFLLCIATFMMTFALSILLVRNIWCLAVNTTTIEGWEIERHRTLVRRARHFGGFLEGPDGVQVRIKKQEFPYDVGIWENFAQGMGTPNVFAWFWPLAVTPSIETGVVFPVNEFEDQGVSWPPPDPDRTVRSISRHVGNDNGDAFTYRDAGLTSDQTKTAFAQRQEEDVLRRRKTFVQRLEVQRALRTQKEECNASEEELLGSDAEEEDIEDTKKAGDGNQSGEEGWRNSEGERLRDFGVDEDVEFYDEEDNIPLSELLARRRAARETTSAASPTTNGVHLHQT